MIFVIDYEASVRDVTLCWKGKHALWFYTERAVHVNS